MANQSIQQMLIEEMHKSKKFTEANFGLQLGSSFPELAREVLKAEAVTTDIFAKYVLATVTATPKNGAWDRLNVPEIVRQTPAMFDAALSYLYWGIQIGRRLQQQQDALLNEMAETRSDK